MVRVTKVLLCGASGVGKSSLVYSLDSFSKSLPDLQKYVRLKSESDSILVTNL